MSRKTSVEEFGERVSGVTKLKASILIAIVTLGIVSIALAGSIFFYVELGEVAIVYDWSTGVIDPIPREGPRWHVKSPLQNYKIVFVATDFVDMWSNFDERGIQTEQGQWPSLDVPSAEGLVLHMDATVRWHIAASEVFNLVKNFPGLDFKDKVIYPAIREVTRDITGKRSALELYGPTRDIISLQIKESLTTRLENDPMVPNTFVLEDFYMRKVWLPISFKNAVELKQVAEQNALKAEFERQQKLIQANATAQAMIIEASGMAQSTVIQAQGIAEAVRVVQSRFQGMTERDATAYLTYLYIQALQQGFTQGNKVILFLPSSGASPPLILQMPNMTNSTYTGG